MENDFHHPIKHEAQALLLGLRDTRFFSAWPKARRRLGWYRSSAPHSAYIVRNASSVTLRLHRAACSNVIDRVAASGVAEPDDQSDYPVVSPVLAATPINVLVGSYARTSCCSVAPPATAFSAILPTACAAHQYQITMLIERGRVALRRGWIPRPKPNRRPSIPTVSACGACARSISMFSKNGAKVMNPNE